LRIKEQETRLTLQEHNDDDENEEISTENREIYEKIRKNLVQSYSK
jgi:hypothetical protein